MSLYGDMQLEGVEADDDASNASQSTQAESESEHTLIQLLGSTHQAKGFCAAAKSAPSSFVPLALRRKKVSCRAVETLAKLSPLSWHAAGSTQRETTTESHTYQATRVCDPTAIIGRYRQG